MSSDRTPSGRGVLWAGPLGLGEQRHVRLSAPGYFPQGSGDRPQDRRLGVAHLIQRQHVPTEQHDKPRRLGRLSVSW